MLTKIYILEVKDIDIFLYLLFFYGKNFPTVIYLCKKNIRVRF